MRMTLIVTSKQTKVEQEQKLREVKEKATLRRNRRKEKTEEG